MLYPSSTAAKQQLSSFAMPKPTQLNLVAVGLTNAVLSHLQLAVWLLPPETFAPVVCWAGQDWLGLTVSDGRSGEVGVNNEHD